MNCYLLQYKSPLEKITEEEISKFTEKNIVVLIVTDGRQGYGT